MAATTAKARKTAIKRALVLGGGAPNATFMSGALVRLIERGIGFDFVAASGAGAVVAMLYLAPNGKDPAEALQNSVNEGISDPLYTLFPVDYKVFQKGGALADRYRDVTGALFGPTLAQLNGSDNAGLRMIADLWQLGLAAMTPMGMDSMTSTGLCAGLPGIEALIDFNKLKGTPGDGATELVINAFNLPKKELRYFSSHSASGITPDHARAALAFPFLYPPHQVAGEDYLEGASFDDVPYEALMNRHERIDEIYLIDVLGTSHLVETPGNLMEAFTLMIVASITAAAKLQVKGFIEQHRHHLEVSRQDQRSEHYRASVSGRDFRYLARPLPKLFLINSDRANTAVDALTWKRSNLAAMYRAGMEAAGQPLEIVHP